MALPEIDPSRKIIPRSRGELNHPGSCAVCGGSDPERTYVDFGIYYDYEGTVYVCIVCFREAVQVMGFFSPEEVQDLLDKLNSLVTQNEALTKELDNARPILDAVASISVHASGASGISDDFGDPNDAAVIEAGTDGKPEITEPANEQDSSGTSGDEPRDRSTPVIV